VKRLAPFVALLTVAAAPPPTLDTVLAKAHFDGAVVTGDGDRPAIVRGEARMPWRWASVTKQLTALIVMQEVAAGRLDLDAPVTRYWADWPHVYADQITLRQLLQHTSGLADPNEDGPNDPDGMPRFYRPAAGHGGIADAAAGYCAQHPRAKPGGAFHYDNCDFIVLGAILERATGKSYATLVRERIGGPLGLRIGLFAPHVRPPATVPGVDKAGHPELIGDLGAYGSAGAAYGTPLALYAFDRALLTHRLLPADATATMWAGDPKLGYAALGQWSFAAPLAGCAAPVAIVERRGQIGGVQVRNFLLPASGRALVMFTPREATDFGEVWQRKGLSFDALSAVACAA
jgi:D-alanyl-D-alanine carboxypeptidase